MSNQKKDELHVRAYDVRSRSWHGVRKRPEQEDVDCYLEPIRDGAPLEDGDEILTMTPGRPGVMELQSHYVHKGPARVASPAYRDNWEQIFGRTKREKKNRTILN